MASEVYWWKLKDECGDIINSIDQSATDYEGKGFAGVIAELIPAKHHEVVINEAYTENGVVYEYDGEVYFVEVELIIDEEV